MTTRSPERIDDQTFAEYKMLVVPKIEGIDQKTYEARISQITLRNAEKIREKRVARGDDLPTFEEFQARKKSEAEAGKGGEESDRPGVVEVMALGEGDFEPAAERGYGSEKAVDLQAEPRYVPLIGMEDEIDDLEVVEEDLEEAEEDLDLEEEEGDDLEDEEENEDGEDGEDDDLEDEGDDEKGDDGLVEDRGRETARPGSVGVYLEDTGPIAVSRNNTGNDRGTSTFPAPRTGQVLSPGQIRTPSGRVVDIAPRKDRTPAKQPESDWLEDYRKRLSKLRMDNKELGQLVLFGVMLDDMAAKRNPNFPNLPIEEQNRVVGLMVDSLIQNRIKAEEGRTEIERQNALQTIYINMGDASNNFLASALANPQIREALRVLANATAYSLAAEITANVTPADIARTDTVLGKMEEQRRARLASKGLATQRVEEEENRVSHGRSLAAEELRAKQLRNDRENASLWLETIQQAVDGARDSSIEGVDNLARTLGGWVDAVWVRAVGNGNGPDDVGIVGNTVKSTLNILSHTGVPRGIGLAAGGTGGLAGGLVLAQALGVSGVLTGDIITGGTALSAALIGIGLGKLVEKGFDRSRKVQGRDANGGTGNGSRPSESYQARPGVPTEDSRGGRPPTNGGQSFPKYHSLTGRR